MSIQKYNASQIASECIAEASRAAAPGEPPRSGERRLRPLGNCSLAGKDLDDAKYP